MNLYQRILGALAKGRTCFLLLRVSEFYLLEHREPLQTNRPGSRETAAPLTVCFGSDQNHVRKRRWFLPVRKLMVIQAEIPEERRRGSDQVLFLSSTRPSEPEENQNTTRGEAVVPLQTPAGAQLQTLILAARFRPTEPGPTHWKV